MLLARIATYSFAGEKAQIFYSSTSLTILRPNQSEELKALSLFNKFSDQKVSFTDCVSFVLMKEAKIKHFQLAGFELF